LLADLQAENTMQGEECNEDEWDAEGKEEIPATHCYLFSERSTAAQLWEVVINTLTIYQLIMVPFMYVLAFLVNR